MRIIHTSDWHLGQRFFGESREEEHQRFLDWLINEIKFKNIDALIVAGDIFDTATPPSYARRLYNDFLAKISLTYCQNIIIIGGNHDSPSVLSEEKNVLKQLNIYVVGGFCSIEDLTIPIFGKDGELKGIIGAVPFLKESDLRDTSKSSDSENRAEELQLNISNFYKKVFECSKKKLFEISEDTHLPIVTTGHLSTIKKLEKVDSMRDIYIGSLEVFDSSLFPPFDYIALGHYHKFVKMKNICYSGSPIHLSFDEVRNEKFILDVEVLADKNIKMKRVSVPKFRDIYKLRGDVKELEKRIKELSKKLLLYKTSSKITPVWIEVEIVELQGFLSFTEVIRKLKSIDKNIKILKSKIVNESLFKGLKDLENEATELKNMNPLNVFKKRLELEKDKLKDEERKKLIDAFLIIQEELASENFES